MAYDKIRYITLTHKINKLPNVFIKIGKNQIYKYIDKV